MSRPQLPRWIVYTAMIAVVASWLPIAFIARARAVRSGDTRIQIIQDMDNQPRGNTQSASTIFADGRTMRPEIPGTVARGKLNENDALYRGKAANGDWVTEFPMPVTDQLVHRGQDRFAIYCFPCHGLDGAGTGPTHQRAVKLGEPKWIPPTSLVSEQVRSRPVGHIFNTITHGIRNMAPYGPQISPEDRWAIISYIRALQLSRDTTIQDVPPQERDRLR